MSEAKLFMPPLKGGAFLHETILGNAMDTGKWGFPDLIIANFTSLDLMQNFKIFK